MCHFYQLFNFMITFQLHINLWVPVPFNGPFSFPSDFFGHEKHHKKHKHLCKHNHSVIFYIHRMLQYSNNVLEKGTFSYSLGLASNRWVVLGFLVIASSEVPCMRWQFDNWHFSLWGQNWVSKTSRLCTSHII